MGDKRDLLILGGGLVGMTLALAAAKKGITSHVVDRADPAALTADNFDGRASAISTASWNLFTNIGLADALEPHGCPIASIAVTDAMRPGRIDFQPEEHEGSLGRMFANQTLRLALFEAARDNTLINWHAKADVVERVRGPHGVSATLADGTVLEASLMVAAEGRQSPTRKEAGLQLAHWDYKHRALIAGIIHEKPHDNVAWEIFYSDGPFALLPMLDTKDGKHRSALVWTVNEAHAKGYLALSDAAFRAEVEKKMHGVFGHVEMNGPRSSYPLSFQHTARITADRLALVGDAAHGIHPIAGQGLNLGIRDVGTLVSVLVDGMKLGLEPGDAQMLKRYEEWRALDGFSVAAATDALTWLFGIPGKLPSAIRRMGMAVVQRTSPLKTFFMNEARGMSGDLPELLREQ
ncbi:ubiquinone biosynthesis protein UbiH [Altererythrobacter indicus]|uniref:Ubiquinone biosynthesis protein UbiH n=1 Tax=Altericroceibacterium indicum TaxID=374177 RepID=A0A845A6L3_9SPHN|nr:FAD-dependent monooxygenase [Altericroceibacterium indicum]MXP26012.1 ubiquinone biosynthesis protein UbiH [Altericroceibacterium indicum]